MIRPARLLAGCCAAVIGWMLFAAASAHALIEFAPAAGKGRVVIVLSGTSGVAHYQDLTRQIAQLGFDAVLIDGNIMDDSSGEALHAAILAAQHSEHALPGKVAVVGFSQGGAPALRWASRFPDVVAAVVAWFPATSFIKDPDDFVSRITVPVLVLAGERDTHRACSIYTARAVAAAATAHHAPLELVVYPNARHGFALVEYADEYNSSAANDGWRRQAILLKQTLGN